MIIPGYLAVTHQVAVLFVAAAGACLIFQQRWLAARLFGTGCVIAAASGFSANTHDVTSALALWLGTVGVCAAILGARRWPIYLIAWAVAISILIPILEPVARTYLPFWWLVPLLVAIALLTAAIVTAALNRLREQVYGSRPTSTLSRFLARQLDRLTGFRRRRPHRDRHIGEFGTTRRGRSGAGPHVI